MLIGLMGAGKSTVGPALAARLRRTFVDNDELLQQQTLRTAREVAASDGAEELHAREAEVLVAALSRADPAVIAAAAAAPMEPGVAAALHPHDVVYLRVAPDVLAARVAGARAADDHRPFVADDPVSVLRLQFSERDERYRALATQVVDARAAPEIVVDEITAALGR